MALFRGNKSKDYTVLCNNHFREREMSLKAKGLLSLMLSLPDGWLYSVAGLTALSKDGKDSVNGAIKELIDFGYIVKTKTRNEAGQFNTVYDVYEFPVTDKPQRISHSGKTATEKPPLLNTNKSITKETNTNKSIKHKYGEYKNVLLTDEELEKLKAKFSDWNKRIETLSQGIELKGYKYKNHYLAILKWAERDVQPTPKREYTDFWSE